MASSLCRIALALGLGLGCGSGAKPVTPSTPTGTPAVVLFLVDGLMYPALQTAIASGARNLELVVAGGVRVETVHTTSPAIVIQLPDGRQPWGRASSGNVAVHTGCHLFESRQMDDIFLAARRAGIKSVFSGGLDNYNVFTTPDFHYGTWMDDDTTVQHAINHLKNDGARLLRVHLQRLRDFWTGPADQLNAGSTYVNHLTGVVDRLLGQLIAALKEAGIWERTHLVLASDHGMDDSGTSAHAAGSRSSWNPVLAFHGPGLKQGATIPYAELPDVAVTVMRFLGLPPLAGHLDPAVDLERKGPTGTVLTNLFAGAPVELAHPRYIERCLQTGAACLSAADDFAPYRQTMLDLISR